MSDEASESSNVSTKHFKKAVVEYGKIDTEVKESSKLLSALRKRQKELHDFVLEFMISNDLFTVEFPNGEVLERFTKETQGPVNGELIGQVASKRQGEQEAADLVNDIYSSRAVKQVEFLKVVNPDANPGSKRKTRPSAEVFGR